MSTWHFIAPPNETVEKTMGIVRCGRCGRVLTDPESVAKGIGPVCEGHISKGGPGSGHHGHEGRPGEIGGSRKGKRRLAQGRLRRRPSRPGKRGGSRPKAPPKQKVLRGDYTGRDLSGLDFRDVKIENADFRAGAFHSTDFTGATFANVQVARADFNSAQFGGADLRGAIGLDKAQMAHAVYDNKTRFPKGFDPENISRGYMYKG